jgi:nucleotide-binding universal stress UspA family protein
MTTVARHSIPGLIVDQPRLVSGKTRLARLLVATSGEPSAEPALRLATALAADTGAAVELVAVFMPRVPIPVQSAARRIACERPDRGLVADMARRVRRQRRDIGAGSVRWPVRLGVGNPPEVIARMARDEAFDAIILGIGRPDPAERLRGDETGLRLALSTSVPVLAVAPGLVARPHRALIAVDSMDDVDHRMIDTVVALLAEPAHLHVALTKSWRFDAASGVDAVREAGVPDSIEVVAVPVPAESSAVINLAREMGAELVAAPTHGRTPEERILFQDLVVPIFRSAHCSVLAVPPAASA